MTVHVVEARAEAAAWRLGGEAMGGFPGRDKEGSWQI